MKAISTQKTNFFLREYAWMIEQKFLLPVFCFSVVNKRFRFSLQSKEKASNTNKRESFPLEMKLWFSNNCEDAHKKLLHLWLRMRRSHIGVEVRLLLLFSHQVVSDSSQPRGLRHAKLLCPSPSPGVCPSSCPFSQWCRPTISSSDTLFSCLHSFSASGSFPVSQLFTSCGQSIGASASASVLPVNIQGWFPLGLTDLISLQSKGLSSVFSSTAVQKPQFFSAQPSVWSSWGSERVTHGKNRGGAVSARAAEDAGQFWFSFLWIFGSSLKTVFW